MGSGSRAMLQQAGTRSDVLVEPRWLEEHLHDPALRLVEVDVSPAAYDKGHIEGAVLWNVYRDLKDHELPARRQGSDRNASWSAPGLPRGRRWCSMATHPPWAFWLMKLYGHADVRILDCARGNVAGARGGPWDHGRGPGLPPAATGSRTRMAGFALTTRRWKMRSTTRPAPSSTSAPRLSSRGERFWPSGGLEAGGRAGHVPSAAQPVRSKVPTMSRDRSEVVRT